MVYDSSDEYNRDERIETYYQGWSARDLAERLVELEDELGEEKDGLCTGMHADVAEAQAEVERLTSLVGYWEHRAEEAQADSTYFEEWATFNGHRLNATTAQRDRYRSAWLSARRRAADEANLGMEALDYLRQAHARELQEIRQSISGPRLQETGPDGEGGTVWRLSHETS
ncbi:hypothetical protein ACWDX6_24025 [Streptomyces sp. NPDC003027]